MKNNMIETALTFYGLYYYVIDTVLTLVEGSYMEICRFALFSHHLPAIPLLYTVSKLNYKPWWALATAGNSFNDYFILESANDGRSTNNSNNSFERDQTVQ